MAYLCHRDPRNAFLEKDYRLNGEGFSERSHSMWRRDLPYIATTLHSPGIGELEA